MNDKLYADLRPDARLEVGRAWNAYARMRQAELEARQAKQDLEARLISLRAGHGLTIQQTADLVGLTEDQVQNWTRAYVDPRFTVLRGPRSDRKGPGRRQSRLVGAQPAPAQEPSPAHTERTDRGPTEP